MTIKTETVNVDPSIQSGSIRGLECPLTLDGCSYLTENSGPGEAGEGMHVGRMCTGATHVEFLIISCFLDVD